MDCQDCCAHETRQRAVPQATTRPHVKCTEHGCSRDTKLCLDDNEVVTWPTRRIPDDTERGEAPGRVANIPRLHHQLSQNVLNTTTQPR